MPQTRPQIGLAEVIRAVAALLPEDDQTFGAMAALLGLKLAAATTLPRADSGNRTDPIIRPKPVGDQPDVIPPTPPPRERTYERSVFSDLILTQASPRSGRLGFSVYFVVDSRAESSYDKRLFENLKAALAREFALAGAKPDEMPQLQRIEGLQNLPIPLPDSAPQVAIVVLLKRRLQPEERKRLESFGIGPDGRRAIIGVARDPQPRSKLVHKQVVLRNPSDSVAMAHLAREIVIALGLRTEASPKIMLSYRASDAQNIASRLRAMLAPRGYQFADEPNQRLATRVGPATQATFNAQISGASLLLVIDTPGIEQSSWVQAEVAVALESRVPVLTIVVAEALPSTSEPPAFASRLGNLNETPWRLPLYSSHPVLAMTKSQAEELLDEDFIDLVETMIGQMLAPRMTMQGQLAIGEARGRLEIPSEENAPRPPHMPLFDPLCSRGLITTMLSTWCEEGRPDLSRLIDAIVHLMPIKKVPRLPATTLRRGVEVLIDRGRGLTLFERDQETLVSDLRDVVGTPNVSVLSFVGCPIRGAGKGPRRCWTAYTPPISGTPVLVLTDLGLATPLFDDEPATVEEWLELALMMRRAGCPLVVLVPYPPKRWPAKLRDALLLLPWDRDVSVGNVRRRVGRRGLTIQGRFA